MFVTNEKERLEIEFESKEWKLEHRLSQDLSFLKKPREFSYSQIREIVFAILHTSQLRKDMLAKYNEIENFKVSQFASIEDLWESIKDIKSSIEEVKRVRGEDRKDFLEHVKEYFRILENDHDSITFLKSRD